MAQVRHIIHRQCLDLNFHGDIAYSGLQQILSRWMNERLLPAMEEVLKEVDIPSGRIRLDELQLDGGTIIGSDWEEQLSENICKDLRNQIRGMALSWEPLQEPGKPGKNEATLSQGSTASYSEAEKISLVLHYLETGHLPWHASGLQASTLLQWIQEIAENGYFTSTEGCSFLAKNPWALRRLLLQTKPVALESWFYNWHSANTREWLPALIMIARLVFGNGHTALAWAYAFLFHLFTKSEASPTHALWLSWIKEYIPDDSGAWSHISKSAEYLVQKQLTIDQWADRMEKLIASVEPAKAQEAVKQNGTPEADKADGYFIGNAGLVIAHPFLLAWFTELKLFDKDHWISNEAHRRAVLLLHYLVTGRNEMAEYELPLCKLLAGYPMEQPVEAVLEPTEKEIEETRSLLEQVIAQWTILKMTSPEGLRQSFLERDGKLSHSDNGWLLQVEQKSFDLLLDHLPWSIGVIRNSWMKEILFTEWM